MIGDILVTDYSSVFFDYAILKRPIYFYMYDLKDIVTELRGFYLDIYQDITRQSLYEDEEALLIDIKKDDFDYSKLHDLIFILITMKMVMHLNEY